MAETDTLSVIEQKKLQSRQRSMENQCYFALRTEAFFIALSPQLAGIALALGVLFWIRRWICDPEFHFRRLPYDVPVFLFILIGAASIAVSPNPAFSFYNYYVLVGAYAFTYFLAGQTLRTEEQLRGIVKMLAWSAALSVIYGFYQFAFGIETADMKWVDGDAFPELRKRVFSTWENPNIFAGYLGEVFAMVFAFFVSEEEKNKRWRFGGVLFAVAACLAMTYARGACFAVALMAAGYGIVKDRRILLGCVVLGGLLLLVDPMLAERLSSVFTKIDTSSEMRLAIWESSAAMILDHPLLGIGWGAYRMVYHEYDFYINDVSVDIYHAHNMYLNYAAEIGVIGAAAYFWFFFGTMISAFLASRSETSAFVRRFELGWALALVTVALGGLTDDVVFNIPTSMLLWLGCAISMAVRGAGTEVKTETMQTQE